MHRKLFAIGVACLTVLFVIAWTDVAYPQAKITGPWLWMIAPTAPGQGGSTSTDIDSLAAASGGAVTEADIATNGANEGDRVGNLVWTLGTISGTGGNNVNDTVTDIGLGWGDMNDHSAYALITLESATAQNNVRMRVGSDDSIKVWLNGTVVHRNPVARGSGDFQDTFSVNLRAGDNLLLVKVSERGGGWSMFVGIDANVNAVYKPASIPGMPPTDTVSDSTASMVVRVSPSQVQSPALGEQLVLNMNITGGENVAGYQLTLHFDTTALRYVSSSNADYLPAGAFVVPPKVSGNQVTLAATSLSGGSEGDGTLATVTFEVVAVKSSSLTLSEVKLTDVDADFLLVSSENGKVVESGSLTEAAGTVVSLTPSPVESPAVGETLTFSVSVAGGKNVAGYALKLAFDATALRYVSSNNADYLPAGAFVVSPVVNDNQVTLTAMSLSGGSQGDGTLATVTFEVVAVKPSTLRFSEVSLTDSDAKALAVSSKNAEVIEVVRLPGDVNEDGIVNLDDMSVAARRVGQTGKNTADMNGDSVVNGEDLLLIAAAIEAVTSVSDSFEDSFEGTTLQNPNWQWQNEPANWDVGETRPGFLHIESEINRNLWISDASHFLYQETEANTFDVETRFFARWDTSSGVNGLVVKSPADNNWVTLKFWSQGGGTRGQIQYQTRGQQSGNGLTADAGFTPTPGNTELFFRLRKDGNTYTGWYKTRETNPWIEIGMTNFMLTPPLQLGIYAGVATHTGTLAVDYDYFRSMINTTGTAAPILSVSAIVVPTQTGLLPNYPNPFNPETWLPYQLARPSDVTVRIYGIDGALVRTLSLGHQPAGIYHGRSRAAYWDGRNALGEPVASGVYFYTLTAGDFAATRKMLIRK